MISPGEAFAATSAALMVIGTHLVPGEVNGSGLRFLERMPGNLHRAFLAKLGAGCATAAAAYATLDGDQMTIRGYASSPDGERSMTQTHSGDAGNAVAMGTELADDMIEQGALELIRG